MLKQPSDPRQSLKTAVVGLRALGSVFILLGSLCAVMAHFTFRRVFPSRSIELLASTTILLLAPGALYHVAAVFITRKEHWAASLSLRTAIAQLILIAVTLATFIALGAAERIVPRFAMLGQSRMILAPAILAVFFVPALIAQVASLLSAMRAVRDLPEDRFGFETLPVSPPPDQPTDSERGK